MSGYVYPQFKRGHVFEVAFAGGVRPGEPFPEFDLPTVDHGRLSRGGLLGAPFVLLCTSRTSPMSRSALPSLRKLHHEFGRRVRFLSLYVREAHPGENVPQPLTFPDKLHHAREHAERERIPWTVLVDDLQGRLHRALGGAPASVYLVDAGGRVAGRVLWANDVRGVRRGLEALVAGRDPGERRARALPLLRGLGVMSEVLETAGPYAQRDLLRAVPPAYALAWLARLLRPLPPLVRGALAVTVGVGVTAAALAAGVTALRRRR